METVRVGRNGLCPCGSGRKSKRCCQNQSAAGGAARITAFEKARPVFGDGAETRRHSPQPALRRGERDGQPIERIPVHYTYAEPFGEAECVYCFPVDQQIILDNGSVVPARWLQAGILFRMEDGTLGTVTEVEPTKVWEPPSRIPDRHGNYARRVLGTIKHKGFAVLDVTFGGQTVTTTPDHLFWSASREAWVPVGSMRPGELLRNVEGAVTPVEAISPPRHGFVELYNLEVEELHTFFVGASGPGSALVHNGQGNYIKKPLQAEAPKDFATKQTKNWSGAFKSESEARQLARTKIGRDPIEVEPGKWRSQDGKWQYRAKPGDLADRHIHLEELDPATGEVLQNLHLRWPENMGR